MLTLDDYLLSCGGGDDGRVSGSGSGVGGGRVSGGSGSDCSGGGRVSGGNNSGNGSGCGWL